MTTRFLVRTVMLSDSITLLTALQARGWRTDGGRDPVVQWEGPLTRHQQGQCGAPAHIPLNPETRTVGPITSSPFHRDATVLPWDHFLYHVLAYNDY